MPGLTLRLDSQDHDLLRILSVVERKSANQLITELIRAHFDKVLPGKRERPLGSASELLRKTLGLDENPVTDEVRQQAMNALHEAERHADALRRGQAPGGHTSADNSHMDYPITVDPATHHHTDITTSTRQGTTKPGRRPGRAA